MPHATTLTPVGAVQLLPLPRIRGLTEDQVCGRACVWCRTSLTAGAVMSLGPRRRPGTESGACWYPRGCTMCVRAEARRVVDLHARTCSTCRGPRACSTRRELLGLADGDQG
ncbi:hypothetical protein [Streptomyces sp. NPDC004629]|uniref:hypothetical protein n=1 Tax=Streptomyces sp. NPDC004629 TaxID=3364705 RepID=UPI0036793A40